MTVGSQDEATSSTQRQPRGVHLVGSVPLADAEAVFRTANAILGGRLRRIPDGETGERTHWIGWQARFITIAITDGVTMGTEGMKASLVSREVIADSIELVGRGHMFDAVIALVGCDKTIPGAAPAGG